MKVSDPLDIHLPISKDDNWLDFGRDSPLCDMTTRYEDIFNTPREEYKENEYKEYKAPRDKQRVGKKQKGPSVAGKKK
jgi:hypothetical protein